MENFRPEAQIPPGYPMLLALIITVVGHSFAVLIRSMAFVTSFGLSAAYELIKSKGGRGIAASTCLLPASFPSGDGVINDRPLNIPRNSMHGPRLINLDLNVPHEFVLWKTPEKTKVLLLSLNSFNVLNHVNDVSYIGVITSSFLGRAVAAQPPRRMQINLQFKFREETRDSLAAGNRLADDDARHRFAVL